MACWPRLPPAEARWSSAHAQAADPVPEPTPDGAASPLQLFRTYQRDVFLHALRRDLPPDMPVRWQIDAPMARNGCGSACTWPTPRSGFPADDRRCPRQRHPGRAGAFDRAGDAGRADRLPDPAPPGTGLQDLARAAGDVRWRDARAAPHGRPHGNRAGQRRFQPDDRRPAPGGSHPRADAGGHLARHPHATDQGTCMAMAMPRGSDDALASSTESYLDQIDTILQQIDGGYSWRREPPQPGDLNALVQQLSSDFAGLGHSFELSIGNLPPLDYRPVSLMRLLMNSDAERGGLRPHRDWPCATVPMRDRPCGGVRPGRRHRRAAVGAAQGAVRTRRQRAACLPGGTGLGLARLWSAYRAAARRLAAIPPTLRRRPSKP